MHDSPRPISPCTPMTRPEPGAPPASSGYSAAAPSRPAPLPDAPATVAGGGSVGELRLRMPRYFVCSDVAMPVTYH